jgi:hypothetical protein
VIDVPDRPYVAVRLGTLKFFLRHFASSGAKAPDLISP